MMSNKFKTLLYLIVFVIQACGTGIGNPITNASSNGSPKSPGESEPVSTVLEFSVPISEYTQNIANKPSSRECGRFSESSTLSEIEVGRQCLKDSFSTCTTARYLIDQTTVSGRFVAFVETRLANSGACEIYTYVVSSNASLYQGALSQTCDTIPENRLPELACAVQ